MFVGLSRYLGVVWRGDEGGLILRERFFIEECFGSALLCSTLPVTVTYSGSWPMLRSHLFRGGAMSLLVQIQLVGVRLLTGILLARLLGPAEFGIYSFAFAAVALIQVIPNNGLDAAIICPRTPGNFYG
jgi:hypothetical protein